MVNRMGALALGLALATGALAQNRPMVGMRSLALSPDGTRIAFTYRGDIWVANATGGLATAITTNVEMDDNPIWSPDGKQIAFSSNRFGSNDIFVVDADGGDTRRVTNVPFGETPNGWSPDGKEIIYRAFYEKTENGIYSVNVKTGAIREFWTDNRNLGFPKFSPDGDSILFVRRYGFPFNRPRYQGSGATELTMVDMAGKRTTIRANGFQHLWPTFMGDQVVAVTVGEKTPSTAPLGAPAVRYTENEAKTPNVYAIEKNGKATRLTDFVGGSGTRFLTASKDKVAFEVDGHAYLMTPGKKPTKVVYTGFIDDKGATEERLILNTGARTFSVSALKDGARSYFEVRGDLWSVPVRRGKGPNGEDATQLTDWAGLDTSPLVDQEEANLHYLSDQEGPMRLFKMDLKTKKSAAITNNTFDISYITWLPGNKNLCYLMSGPEGGLYTFDVTTKASKLIVKGGEGFDFAFSPDMKYVAYTTPLLGSGFNPWENKNVLVVKDLTTNQVYNISNTSANHGLPEWSRDGKYLYFTSERDGGGLFALPLQPEDGRPTELELKYEKPKEMPKWNFDFTNVDDRIRRIVPGAVNGFVIADPTNGDIYFRNGGELFKVGYDGEGARPMAQGGGVFGAALSFDENSLYVIREGNMQVVNLRHPQQITSPIGFRADWTRYVGLERRAALAEFWRQYNQNFYDPNFHGRNWGAIRERYEPLLDGVAHRNEMATVLNMMVGELESSHSEVGPAFGNPPVESAAHLGFDWDYSHQGPGIKVNHVPKGSPAWYPKTKIKSGEFVMEVNGRAVAPNQASWRTLVGQAGRDITLTVNSTPSLAGARKVTYRAISDSLFDALTESEDLEANRVKVAQVSKGKVGYIHIAAMGGGDFQKFNADVWDQINGRQGLIIDVRSNGGGNISDQLMDILERGIQAYYKPRHGDVVTAPGTVVNRSIVVMFDENSLSNGEMFPGAMKDRKLAQTVGWPTPGYVIYTYGGRLIDGTSIRLPSTGVYRLDKQPLENNGVVPDFKIDRTPEDVKAGRDPQLDKAISLLASRIK